MAENVSLWGATYPDVPQIVVPIAGGGHAHFVDVSETDISAADVLSGRKAYLSDGTLVTGTATEGVAAMKPYVIRPDASLYKRWSLDQYVHADMGITIPAYSTAAKTLVAASVLANDIEFDFDYDFYLTAQYLVIPEYSVTTKAKGRIEYSYGSYLYDFCTIPPNTMHALLNSTAYTSRTTPVLSCGLVRQLYWSSGTALALYTASTYGLAPVSTAPSISGNTLTISSPSIAIRGHATYFTSAYYGKLTDVRFQYIMELWRVKQGDGNVDAWGTRQQTLNLINCAQSQTHTLT